MVRSVTRVLAGTAVSAARTVLGRRAGSTDGAATGADPVPDAAPNTTTTRKTARRATARKAATKKAVTKKAVRKKAVTRKTTVKKTTATAGVSPAAQSPTPTTSKVSTVTTAKKTTTKTAPAATKTAAKKRTGKASTADLLASLVVKDGEEAWTAAELQEVIDELHEARSHSLVLLEEAETDLDGLMRDSGDGAGQDQADMGATTFERDHELAVVNSERDKLAQLDRALGHIDDGTYGVCEACAEPIGKGRLMAFPRATLCMTCKQREERR